MNKIHILQHQISLAACIIKRVSMLLLNLFHILYVASSILYFPPSPSLLPPSSPFPLIRSIFLSLSPPSSLPLLPSHSFAPSSSTLSHPFSLPPHSLPLPFPLTSLIPPSSPSPLIRSLFLSLPLLPLFGLSTFLPLPPSLPPPSYLVSGWSERWSEGERKEARGWEGRGGKGGGGEREGRSRRDVINIWFVKQVIGSLREFSNRCWRRLIVSLVA